MISKEFFIKTIEQLKEVDMKMDNLDNAFSQLSSDFCHFYFPDAITLAVSILEEIFNDKETGWISYFIWERNWLKDFKLGDVTIDGEPVKIDSWGDVYDFLIDDMEM